MATDNNTRGRSLLKELFQNQSIFRRIFLSLMSFLMILILVVTYWVNQVSDRGQQVQIMRSSLARMEAASRTLEQVFDDLTASMTQLLWTDNFLKYLLLPVPEDQTRFSAIQRQLNNVSRSTWVVKQISFFCDYSERVFRSDTSSVFQLSEYPDAFLFETDWEEADDGVLYYTNEERETSTWLITRDGRIFLRQNLFMGKSLGSVVYELNTAIVNGFISNSNSQPQENIFPYAGNGQPVLTGVLDYPLPSLREMGEDERTITLQNVENIHLKKGVQFYQTEGRRLPWTFLKVVNRADMRVSILDTVHAWLPLLLFLFLVSLLVTATVIYSIQKPVNRLLKLAGGGETAGGAQKKKTSKDKTRPQNEFAVLENAYSQAMNRHEEMSQLVENLAPDALDSILLKMLNGRSEEKPERLEKVLSGMGDPLPVRGRFLMVACLLEEPEGRIVTEEERELYRESLRKRIEGFAGKGYTLHSLRVQPDSMALLLSFRESTSAVAIKKVFVELQKALEQQNEVLPFRVWVESGQPFMLLTDCRQAWQEGLERIRYRQKKQLEQKEASSHAASSFAETGDLAEKMERRFWLQEQAGNIASLYSKGERPGASMMAENTVYEIASNCENLEKMKNCYMIFLEEMAGKAIAFPLTAEEQLLLDEKAIGETARGAADSEELQHFVLERCRAIGHLLYTYNRKSRYKYLDLARGYIAEHYTESDLALADVAEHIGISASYLSELWSELGGERFSVYLASYRVEQARQLLQNTDLPVKEIGTRCGFNSVQNFNRVFKKYTGVTPGQYREGNVSPEG